MVTAIFLRGLCGYVWILTYSLYHPLGGGGGGEERERVCVCVRERERERGGGY